MTTRKSSKRGNYRISLRLDLEMDADLIGWLESVPKGQRSDTLRTIIRGGLETMPIQMLEQSPVSDLDAIRSIVADEIRKALKDRQFISESPALNLEQHDLESKYGNKLDRMLGGLSGNHDTGA
jgi:hypothetical protein